MEIDIRDNDKGLIDVIRITSPNENKYCVEYIELNDAQDVFVCDKDASDKLFIFDKKHALDIIKGINKAIELGWLK